MLIRRSLHAIRQIGEGQGRLHLIPLIIHAADQLNLAKLPIPIAFPRTLHFRILERQAVIIGKPVLARDVTGKLKARIAEIFIFVRPTKSPRSIHLGGNIILDGKARPSTYAPR